MAGWATTNFFLEGT